MNAVSWSADDDLLLERQLFGFGLEQSAPGEQFQAPALLRIHGGADIVELDAIGAGDFLRGLPGGHHVGASVLGVTCEPRLNHGYFGPGDREPADLDRQACDSAERIEDCS